ncbi:alcohol-forming fatty acyl-CoA reductase-like [Capsicum annuum]|uniref:alcohol-forming fatty acyl-CoA reductase-like n=1 Tax=Capsicum annuum TaxID=4072 RepID=UPI001FB1818B|nr:alcohol-forming fatty acyl-CoA reductase-like [Capsicum annuum]
MVSEHSPSMESRSIDLQFLEGKTIFITGVTGYLAKILSEKILGVQPNVKKLYLLIRAPDPNSAKQRFVNEVLKTDLFRVLREKLGANLQGFIQDKVFPVPRDIACDSFGINSELKDLMCREVDIIVNSAATTRFDERYDTAISVNVVGAMHVVEFSGQCSKLKMLLHVSTAYVCGEKEGLILEKPLNYGETLNGRSSLDIHVERKLVEEALKDLQDKNATEKEGKATWMAKHILILTKAMGEMLLGHFKEDLQLIILRTTIILITYKDPFPGWIEGLRTTDTFIAGYGKGKQNVLMGDRQSIMDEIPADMVVNSVIAAMVAHQDPSSHTVVYHISSSKRNQLKSGDIIQFFVDYFKKNPWIDESGKPVKVKKFHVLVSMDMLHNFDDTNAEMLRMATKDSNADGTFNFDPTTIQWEKYFKETHIPGVVKVGKRKIAPTN